MSAMLALATRFLTGVMLCVTATTALAAPVSQPPSSPMTIRSEPALAKLEGDLARLSRSLPGRVGFAALHVSSGRIVALRGSEPFSMASVVKLPVAVVALAAVEQGKLRLDERLKVQAADLRPVSPLAERPGIVGSSVPVAELLALMLIESDNTAADLLIARLGGPAAISERLRSLGIAGVRVDRPELLLWADSTGFIVPEANERTLAELRRRAAAVTPEQRAAAERRFASDPRDTATPVAIAQLLAKVQRGELLKADSRRLLLGLMERCRTGPRRLRGKLPAGTIVAHKTGTNGFTVNDVGLITTSEGQVAVAIFVESERATFAQREALIAQMARRTFDAFRAARE